MNGSVCLGRLLDDKLWTRIKMAEVGVAYPETLAFAYRGSSSRYQLLSGMESITIVAVDDKNNQHDLIQKQIHKFLMLPYMNRHDKVW